MTVPCFRCGEPINQPVTENARYVIGTDMIETVPTEIVVGLRHSESTQTAFNELRDAYPGVSEERLVNAVVNDSDTFEQLGLPDAAEPGGLIETVTDRFLGKSTEEKEQETRDMYPGLDDFDRVTGSTVNEVRKSDGVLRVMGEVVDREVQKTGLVHPDEVLESDTVIW